MDASACKPGRLGQGLNKALPHHTEEKLDASSNGPEWLGPDLQQAVPCLERETPEHISQSDKKPPVPNGQSERGPRPEPRDRRGQAY